ncbi:hypothetical protein E4U55_000949 [Claviceps digitariae]|nr:hypothetical protein E4U55_000949 [Claviceps digitariae]
MTTTKPGLTGNSTRKRALVGGAGQLFRCKGAVVRIVEAESHADVVKSKNVGDDKDTREDSSIEISFMGA